MATTSQATTDPIIPNTERRERDILTKDSTRVVRADTSQEVPTEAAEEDTEEEVVTRERARATIRRRSTDPRTLSSRLRTKRRQKIRKCMLPSKSITRASITTDIRRELTPTMASPESSTTPTTDTAVLAGLTR